MAETHWRRPARDRPREQQPERSICQANALTTVPIDSGRMAASNTSCDQPAGRVRSNERSDCPPIGQRLGQPRTTRGRQERRPEAHHCWRSRFFGHATGERRRRESSIVPTSSLCRSQTRRVLPKYPAGAASRRTRPGRGWRSRCRCAITFSLMRRALTPRCAPSDARTSHDDERLRLGGSALHARRH
jgi:hypothetical protein